MLTKIQNLRKFQVDNYILATVGALLVAASSLKFVVPAILILFTLVLGWRKLNREAFVLSAPIMVFSSYQYLQLALRPESLAYYGDLSKVYLVVFCVALPYANMLLMRPLSLKTLEVSVFLGSWATMIFWGFYHFAYDGGCRIEPFGINALFIPITLLPLTYFFIALRVQEGRSNAVDSLTIVATLFCVASFTGSRMPFYTLVFALMCVLGHLIYNRKTKSAGLFLLTLSAGLILALIKDGVSGCNMFQRITDQLTTFSPNQAAAFMVIGLIVSAAIILYTKNNFRNMQVTLKLFLGIAIVVISFTYIGGGFTYGAEHTVSGALASSEDSSTWTRWSFYINSLKFLTSAEWNWLYGNGALAESDIVNKGATGNFSFTHAHNQYLSWLIAGGVIGLSSGLLLAGQLWRHIFSDLPTFIFLILLGLPFLTNSPMYNAPITAQVLFLMLTMQIISFVRHGKRKIV
jgi:hypothetical protein